MRYPKQEQVLTGVAWLDIVRVCMLSTDVTGMHARSKLNGLVVDDVDLWWEATALYETVFINGG